MQKLLTSCTEVETGADVELTLNLLERALSSQPHRKRQRQNDKTHETVQKINHVNSSRHLQYTERT